MERGHPVRNERKSVQDREGIRASKFSQVRFLRAGCPRSINMNRNITGTIRKTDGTVWPGAIVEFELERSSYDAQAQYPVKPIRAETNDDGEFSTLLWVNAGAERPARYICTLPDGSQFRFTLPQGLLDVDLCELRESAVEDNSPTQSDLIAFLPVLNQKLNEELVDVNAAIATKASQTALNAAIDQLESSISQAQSLLENLIDQKADLTHTHNFTDVQGGANYAVAVFDGNGDLSATSDLQFYDGKLGIGVTIPETTLDITHPGAGNQSRISAKLNAPVAEVILIADPGDPQGASLSFDCGGVINTIESDPTGILNLGTESVTPSIGFRTVSGTTLYKGLVVGEHSSPTIHEFPEHGSFGFYKEVTGFDTDVQLAFNYDGTVHMATLK